jgi:hypothetical protein
MTAVTREEWDLLPEGSKPAIRFCMPVFANPDQKLFVPTAEIRNCAWCAKQVWVDMAQELPAEARRTEIMLLCAGCVLDHPTMGPIAVKNMPEVYQHWLRTGVVKAIKIDEE